MPRAFSPHPVPHVVHELVVPQVPHQPDLDPVGGGCQSLRLMFLRPRIQTVGLSSKGRGNPIRIGIRIRRGIGLPGILPTTPFWTTYLPACLPACLPVGGRYGMVWYGISRADDEVRFRQNWLLVPSFTSSLIHLHLVVWHRGIASDSLYLQRQACEEALLLRVSEGGSAHGRVPNSVIEAAHTQQEQQAVR